MPPEHIGVVITTYNSPLWLAKVLLGYEQQSQHDFTVIIADDGSGDETRAVISRFRERGILRLEHVWQEDEGFRKCRILNQAIARTSCDYLVFTDGDCIPQPNLLATHQRLAAPGYFLSGGYIKLTLPVSESLTEEDISSGAIFDRNWLIARGQPRSHKLWKLLREPWKQNLLNRMTPAGSSWNGMNSSGSAAAISRATRTEPFEPSVAGERTISAPNIRSVCFRSSEVFSGITQVSG
jgi:glycosyltransferase involved in cell wall biosynthesis